MCESPPTPRMTDSRASSSRANHWNCCLLSGATTPTTPLTVCVSVGQQPKRSDTATGGGNLSSLLTGSKDVRGHDSVRVVCVWQVHDEGARADAVDELARVEATAHLQTSCGRRGRASIAETSRRTDKQTDTNMRSLRAERPQQCVHRSSSASACHTCARATAQRKQGRQSAMQIITTVRPLTSTLRASVKRLKQFSAPRYTSSLN